MTELVVQSTTEHGSFSSYSTVLGASMIVAALLSSPVPIPQSGLSLDAAIGAHREQSHFDHSYSESRIVQSSIDHQLFVALQDLYSSLVSTQQDLEPDTRKLLYSNLWALYV